MASYPSRPSRCRYTSAPSILSASRTDLAFPATAISTACIRRAWAKACHCPARGAAPSLPIGCATSVAKVGHCVVVALDDVDGARRAAMARFGTSCPAAAFPICTPIRSDSQARPQYQVPLYFPQFAARNSAARRIAASVALRPNSGNASGRVVQRMTASASTSTSRTRCRSKNLRFIRSTGALYIVSITVSAIPLCTSAKSQTQATRIPAASTSA